jgi:hypothetical protein
MSCFSNKALIRRRIGGREPVLNGGLQPVTYKNTISHDDEMRKWKNKRWVSFILFNVWWIVTTTRCQHECNIPCVRHIPKSSRILSVDAFPSNEISDQTNIYKQSDNNCAPSITTLILPIRPCTTPSVCVTIIRASSWVSRSNLRRTVSISPSPSNFLVNFSTAHLSHELYR